MKAATLLKELTSMTLGHLENVKAFLSLSEEILNWRAAEGSWSILECAEHLNRYGDFYLILLYEDRIS